MTTPSGLLQWGQAGQYNAVDDRMVITALANGRRGLVAPPKLAAGSGLLVTVPAGWLAVVSCADGTAAVVGSRLAVAVTVPAGPATGSLTSYIWCDIDPDDATWSISVITPAQATGRTGVQLGTVVANAGQNTAAAMTITSAPPGYGNVLAAVNAQAVCPAATWVTIGAWQNFTLPSTRWVMLVGYMAFTAAAPAGTNYLQMTGSALDAVVPVVPARSVVITGYGTYERTIMARLPAGPYQIVLQAYAQNGGSGVIAAGYGGAFDMGPAA